MDIHRWRVRFIKPYPVSSTTDYNYFYSVAFYPPNTPTAVCCEVRSGSRVVFYGSCIEVGNLKEAISLSVALPSIIEALRLCQGRTPSEGHSRSMDLARCVEGTGYTPVIVDT